jgi:hypothetical protein
MLFVKISCKSVSKKLTCYLKKKYFLFFFGRVSTREVLFSEPIKQIIKVSISSLHEWVRDWV